MDVRMPEMDGVAATQIIFKQFPKTRVLVLQDFRQMKNTHLLISSE
jgi:DNA-binding NarL/FixJ family response regulator